MTDSIVQKFVATEIERRWRDIDSLTTAQNSAAGGRGLFARWIGEKDHARPIARTTWQISWLFTFDGAA